MAVSVLIVEDDRNIAELLQMYLEKERDDLMNYVNLFGYNPKYGVEGKPIGSVSYKAQPYNPTKPLYL